MGKVKIRISSGNPRMLVAFLVAFFAIIYLAILVNPWFLLLFTLLPVEIRKEDK